MIMLIIDNKSHQRNQQYLEFMMCKRQQACFTSLSFSRLQEQTLHECAVILHGMLNENKTRV